MKKHYKEFLSEPIGNLTFSAEFKSMAHTLGFSNLEEMLRVKVSELLEMSGFTYHNLLELFQYLEKEGLADLLVQE